MDNVNRLEVKRVIFVKNINCLRCDAKMNYAKTEQIQLGEHGWFLGDLPHLLKGAMTVDIYVCPKCGKIEFYQSEESEESELPQIKCPKCGKMHDFDYPKCPFCKYEY